MRYYVKIGTGEADYLQGFDINGIPITGIKDVAHKYPNREMARTALLNAHNARNRTFASVLDKNY
jgi:hypothetical protein